MLTLLRMRPSHRPFARLCPSPWMEMAAAAKPRISRYSFVLRQPCPFVVFFSELATASLVGVEDPPRCT